MNLLFCLSYHRAVKNILPAIESLSRVHRVFYFCYRQMSSHFSLPDPRADFRPWIHGRLTHAGANFLGEPVESHSTTVDTYSRDFRTAIKGINFDLAIFDENLGKITWGSPLLYRILRSMHVPVCACQEGSIENDKAGLGRIASNLGLVFDYCFCIGEWDKERLLGWNPNLNGRIYSVGLPSNDILLEYKSKEIPPKHILVVAGWTGKAKGRFEPMTDALIAESGVYDLSSQSGLPVLIKEKARPGRDYVFQHLIQEGVQVTGDESNLDQMVAESLYVVGAPSTLLFKALQLHIPTAVLGKPYIGQFGVLQNFEGMTDSSRQAVAKTLERQKQLGGMESSFIEQAIAGGSDFTSTQKFLDAINAALEQPSQYQGALRLNGPFRERISMRFPRFCKKMRKYSSQLLGR